MSIVAKMKQSLDVTCPGALHSFQCQSADCQFKPAGSWMVQSLEHSQTTATVLRCWQLATSVHDI